MKRTKNDKLLFRLLLENRHRMYGYIFSLVRNRADAEDLLQETSITLWEKFDQFDPETDFIPLGIPSGSLEGKELPTQAGRSKITFSDELLELIANRYESLEPRLGRRREVLQDCLESSTTLTGSLFYLATNQVPTRKQQRNTQAEI